jgi:NTP pyrophosphatase (non-canonical NTP hydrolase)
MKFNDYQQRALTTVISEGNEFNDLLHWVLGINGESGEIAEKVKKIIRDKGGRVSAADKQELGREIGDVLWYLAVFAHHLGIKFDDVAADNLHKLADRQKRGRLQGSGDHR